MPNPTPEALVVKWRAGDSGDGFDGPDYDRGVIETRLNCADELQAALAASKAEREFYSRDFYEAARAGKVPWPGASKAEPAGVDVADGQVFIEWNRSRPDPYVRVGFELVVLDHLRRYAALSAPPAEVEAALAVARDNAQASRQAIKLLVAAGFVTEAKANEALSIAHGFERGPLAPAGGEVIERHYVISDKPICEGSFQRGDGKWLTLERTVYPADKPAAGAVPDGVVEVTQKWNIVHASCRTREAADRFREWLAAATQESRNG